MLSRADRTQIEASKLFGPVGIEEVNHLFDSCTIEKIEPGTHLLEPGQSNSKLYLVLEGELLVYPGGAGLPEHVALGLGDCVGEMSLIDGHQASALVLASVATRLFVIPHDIVWNMIERSHGIARNMLGILAGRMRNDNLALVASQSRSLEFEVAASVDALTGLHNRRWMQDAFTRAMQRCEHDAEAVCLILADIDHFRRFNEHFGHLTGDGILRMVGRKLVEGLRSQDLLVRYGGEEFALLLPQTTIETGFQIANRLCLSVAGQAVVVNDNAIGSVTISCGVASMGLDQTLEQLLAAADKALLHAKRNGRNRVERAAH